MTSDPRPGPDAYPEDDPVPYTLTPMAKAALAAWASDPADLAEAGRGCSACPAPATCSESGRCPLDA